MGGEGRGARDGAWGVVFDARRSRRAGYREERATPGDAARRETRGGAPRLSPSAFGSRMAKKERGVNVCHAAPWSAGPGGLGAWTHQIFSCPFLDLSSFTSELHTVQPPSYRYLSCQSSGWSSRFEAAATTPRRALTIFPLPLETAGLAARAGPWGARAANRDVAGIAAVAVGIDIRARANRWPARRASRDDVASPKRDTFLVARTALVSSVRSKRCVIPPLGHTTRRRPIGVQIDKRISLEKRKSQFPGNFGVASRARNRAAEMTKRNGA